MDSTSTSTSTGGVSTTACWEEEARFWVELDLLEWRELDRWISVLRSSTGLPLDSSSSAALTASKTRSWGVFGRSRCSTKACSRHLDAFNHSTCGETHYSSQTLLFVSFHSVFYTIISPFTVGPEFNSDGPIGSARS